MSLGLRLNLLILMLLLLLAGAGAATVVVNARTAVAREIESSVGLTLGLLTAAGAASDPAALNAVQAALVERLATLEEVRHLDIAVTTPGSPPLVPAEGDAPAEADAPAWFVRLVRPTTVEYRHRIGAPGAAAYSEIAIRPDAADEIAEAWVQSRAEVLLLVSFAAVAMLLISWTVARAFRPVGEILTALDVIRRGDYSTRLPEPTLPEFRRIVHELNAVATQLDSQDRENRELRRRALAIQESERRTLAQELHDELGQSISAIKALAVSIGQPAACEADVRERARAIADICDALHGNVRNMTKRLRPVVLDELGLHTALVRAVEEWREHHRDTRCTLVIEGDLDGLDDDMAINVYRIVQECLTNVARHAHASRVDVRVVRTAGEAASVQVEVQDDGVGFDALSVRGGLGLSGIRERALSVQGDLRIDSAPGRGTCVRVSIPLVPVARAGAQGATDDGGRA